MKKPRKLSRSEKFDASMARAKTIRDLAYRIYLRECDKADAIEQRAMDRLDKDLKRD